MFEKFTFKVMTFIFLCFGFLAAQTLPTAVSTLFSGSGNCAVCHQPGAPNPSALRDSHGNDISPVTLWRSTMMANAAKDPFWQAKVTAEVAAHPQYQQFIEDKCTTCHAPLGRTEAHFNGQQYYSLAEMQSDVLALDGVSCTSCHQIKDTNLGTPESFSGHYIIENDRTIYGPFQNPLTTPMQNSVNYTPVFGEQVHTSDLCATCHTLFTPTLDNNGNIVGEIAEQTPYLEWRNSAYPGMDAQCQECHMPHLNSPVVISNRPMSLSGRAPFAKHYFVGANIFMLNVLKSHGAEIGVSATAAQFDSTIARTLDLLQKETVELSTQYKWISNDSLEVKVAIQNKAGHKFPTGYPSRRAWVYLGLFQNEQPLFESGNWDPQTGEIIGLDVPFEPHYNVIKSSDQVQVYQAVMQDVDGNVTYTLLRGASYVKDNRIPPVGFTSQGSFYDSTAIAGFAQSDPNFNIHNGTEGSGADTVVYRIGNLNRTESYRLNVQMLYQSIAPRFVEDLFQYTTPEVQTFQGYYQQADKSPIVIDSLQVAVAPTGIAAQSETMPQSPVLMKAYPMPFNPSLTIELSVKKSGNVKLSVYNVLGEQVRVISEGWLPAGQHHFHWNAETNAGLLVTSGMFFVKVDYEDPAARSQFTDIQKIIYLR